MFLDNRDFTLNQYEKLCNAIKGSDYENPTIREYLEKKPGKDGVILLRHDVDRDVRFARDMARLEYARGIRSTYYFRRRRNVFVPPVIEEIASYGHEIGYHYETVDQCRGDLGLAVRKFEEDLAVFRERFDVKTACMHGNPLTRHDNRDIWKIVEPARFGLVGEPYLSLDYRQFYYYSDSGRSWDLNKNKVKDTIGVGQAGPAIRCTGDLIGVIERSYPHNICVLAHPLRWSKNWQDYVVRSMVDGAYIAGKMVLAGVR